MHSDEVSSVLLSALQGAWHCQGAQVLPIPAGGRAVPAGDPPGLRLYWVDQALCSLSWDGGRELLVRPGSLVVLPRGAGHRLAPAGNGMAWTLTAVWPASAWCASLLVDDAPVITPLGVDDQPDALRALRARGAAAGADGTTQTAHAAINSHDALPAACATALMLPALHAVESTPARSIVAAALAHPRLGAWLRDVLPRTGPLPSIDDCAARCHLSRAAFTRHFSGLTGLSCAEFLTRWRMNAALHRLALGDSGTGDGGDVGDIAALYGYESEASFRKAFRRATGLTPGAVRRAGSIDAALGYGPGAGAGSGSGSGAADAVATPPTLPPLRKAAPRVAVTTHATPPDLAAMLSALISGL